MPPRHNHNPLPWEPWQLFPCHYHAWQQGSHLPEHVSMRIVIDCRKIGVLGNIFFVEDVPRLSSPMAEWQRFATFQHDVMQHYIERLQQALEYPDLPARVWTAMFYGKIRTPEILFAMSDKAILRLEGLGPTSVAHIRAVQQRGPVRRLPRDAWDEWAAALPGWQR